MRPSLAFTVTHWAGPGQVLAVRLWGHNDVGEVVDRELTFAGIVDIADVQTMVAKMNKGSYRRL